MPDIIYWPPFGSPGPERAGLFFASLRLPRPALSDAASDLQIDDMNGNAGALFGDHRHGGSAHVAGADTTDFHGIAIKVVMVERRSMSDKNRKSRPDTA